MLDNRTVAAIDCGTNSIRLLIAKKAENGSVVDQSPRLVRINRLGYGVDKTHQFDVDALKRTFEFEEEFKTVIEQFQIPLENIRFIATSAARDAENREVFFEKTNEILGVLPEVISGETEADLSFQGVISAQKNFDSSKTTLVIDLGGGSTELIIGKDNKRLAAVSMNVGSVRITERHWGFEAQKLEKSELEAAENDILSIFEDGFEQLEKQGVRIGEVEQVVAVAGTVTTLTAHALKLQEYNSEKVNGTFLTLQQVKENCDAMINYSKEDVRNLPFINPGRVDVIQAGALIFSLLLESVSAARVKSGKNELQGSTTSEHDILDGIALSLL